MRKRVGSAILLALAVAFGVPGGSSASDPAPSYWFNWDPYWDNDMTASQQGAGRTITFVWSEAGAWCANAVYDVHIDPDGGGISYPWHDEVWTTGPTLTYTFPQNGDYRLHILGFCGAVGDINAGWNGITQGGWLILQEVKNTDGDDLPDHLDVCPYDAGPASNNGCPLPPEPTPQPTPGTVTADFTSDPKESGRAMRLDASASKVPSGATASYEWDFDADGDIDETSSVPVVDHVYSDTGRRDARLVVRAGGGSDEVTKPVDVPYDTVLVLLNGIEPTGIALKKSPYEIVGAATNYAQILNSLGCTTPYTSARITRQCNDGTKARLYWSPYSYLGPNGRLAPKPYGGGDTFKPLSVTSAYLGQQIAQIRLEHPDANIVLVGHSEGGTVASRWAADSHSDTTPVITLDSMPYGFWPEDKSSSWPEDVANFCGPSRAGNALVGNEILSTGYQAYFQTVCSGTWAAFGGAGDAGYRSDVSYDWRGHRVFGQDGNLSHAVPLTLFNAVNRFDLIAPPWWDVSPLSDGNKIVTCVEQGVNKTGHSCIRELSLDTADVFSGVTGVLQAALDAAEDLRTPTLSEARSGWGATSNPAQFGGFTTTIKVPAGSTIVALGEWGRGDGADAGKLTCLTPQHTAPNEITVTSADWRARSYVVYWRGNRGNDMRSRVRVLPYSDATEFTANISGSDGLIYRGAQCAPPPPSSPPRRPRPPLG